MNTVSFSGSDKPSRNNAALSRPAYSMSLSARCSGVLFTRCSVPDFHRRRLSVTQGNALFVSINAFAIFDYGVILALCGGEVNAQISRTSAPAGKYIYCFLQKRPAHGLA